MASSYPHRPAGRQPLGHPLDTDDAMGAHASEHEVMEQPDRALSDYNDCLADQRGKPAAAEHNRAELLRHQQVRLRHIPRKPQQEVGPDELIAGEDLRLPDVGHRQHEVARHELCTTAVDHFSDALVARVAVRQRKLVAFHPCRRCAGRSRKWRPSGFLTSTMPGVGSGTSISSQLICRSPVARAAGIVGMGHLRRGVKFQRFTLERYNVGLVYGTETVYCTQAWVRLF